MSNRTFYRAFIHEAESKDLVHTEGKSRSM